MNKLFNTVKMTAPASNSFDLSHDVKLSLNMGELVPIMCLDALPGDRFNISAESLLKLAPMVAPVMHRCDVTIHYFAVPKRLLWEGWDKFIRQAVDAPAFPYLNFTGASTSSFPLADYLGMPITPGTQVTPINPMAFSAYQMIYNEYYRDQNLIAEIPYKLTNGSNIPNESNLLAMRKRAWEHDYFTSALPFAQKGNAVDLPLGDVQLKTDWNAGGIRPNFVDDNGTVTDFGTLEQEAGPSQITAGSGTDPLAYDPAGTLETSPTTITDLRRAERLQQFMEKLARGGSRMTEYIRAIFGVVSSDARLQRPEYITGMKSPVIISETLNTTGTTEAPQGERSGNGVAVLQGNSGYYFCEEHCYIMGIMSVMPKTAYQQGIPKHFLKLDALDHYVPDFAHIGEQEILNHEIYGFTATGNEPFGYTPRYAEYKFENNRVAGEFRDSLDFWHMGRIFSSQPALNQQFVECNPTHRIFAVIDPAVEKIYAHVYNKVRAVRKMPKFGTPQF